MRIRTARFCTYGTRRSSRLRTSRIKTATIPATMNLTITEVEMDHRTNRKICRRLSVVLMIVGFAVVNLSGCKRDNGGQAGPVAEPSAGKAANEATPVSAFERDLQYVRNGGFGHIWIFSRKDGRPRDRDGRAHLTTKKPQAGDVGAADQEKKESQGRGCFLPRGRATPS